MRKTMLEAAMERAVAPYMHAMDKLIERWVEQPRNRMQARPEGASPAGNDIQRESY